MKEVKYFFRQLRISKEVAHSWNNHYHHLGGVSFLNCTFLLLVASCDSTGRFGHHYGLLKHNRRKKSNDVIPDPAASFPSSNAGVGARAGRVQIVHPSLHRIDDENP